MADTFVLVGDHFQLPPIVSTPAICRAELTRSSRLKTPKQDAAGWTSVCSSYCRTTMRKPSSISRTNTV